MKKLKMNNPVSIAFKEGCNKYPSFCKMLVQQMLQHKNHLYIHLRLHTINLCDSI